jgi:hypothetical protein
MNFQLEWKKWVFAIAIITIILFNVLMLLNDPKYQAVEVNAKALEIVKKDVESKLIRMQELMSKLEAHHDQEEKVRF